MLKAILSTLAAKSKLLKAYCECWDSWIRLKWREPSLFALGTNFFLVHMCLFVVKKSLRFFRLMKYVKSWKTSCHRILLSCLEEHSCRLFVIYCDVERHWNRGSNVPLLWLALKPQSRILYCCRSSRWNREAVFCLTVVCHSWPSHSWPVKNMFSPM